ncbi:MAG: SDR family oxidoreductase [Bacteroidota bacterium]
MKYTLVTGGNAGIGKATATALVQKGHNVIIACRSEEKAQQAVADIKTTTNKDAIDYLICDLSSFASIRECVAAYRQQVGQLDVLINNAGLITDQLQFTEDGLEMQIGVNHFGHFLLTQQLMDVLQQAPEARIINISSAAHYNGKINFDSFKGEIGADKYSGFVAYAQSKLANVLFTKELAKRYPSVCSHSLHPGVVGTALANKHGNTKWWTKIWKFLKPLMLSTASGAKTSVYLATSPAVLETNGKYFDKQKEKKAAPLANDAALAQRFWEVSEALTS